jgi:hypothetical protein
MANRTGESLYLRYIYDVVDKGSREALAIERRIQNATDQRAKAQTKAAKTVAAAEQTVQRELDQTARAARKTSATQTTASDRVTKERKQQARSARDAASAEKQLDRELISVAKKTVALRQRTEELTRAQRAEQKAAIASGRAPRVTTGGRAAPAGPARRGGGVGTTAKTAIGLGATYLGVSQATKAIDQTEQLAKATGGLVNNLGLANKEASEWAAVATARGIDNKALTASFTILSKQLDAAGDGNAKAIDSFKRLGFTTDDIKRSQTDFSFAVGKTADGINNLPKGVDRVAASSKVLGRGYAQILPLLRDGSDELDRQLGLAAKYGATIDGKTIKSVNQLIQAQREMKLANLGLQISFTRNVAPSLVKASQAYGRFAQDIAAGKSDKAFDDLFKKIGDLAEEVAPRLTKNAGQLGVSIAKGMVSGFFDADPLSRLVVGAWLVKKMGGPGAFRRAGLTAGAEVGAGMSAGLGTGVGRGAGRGAGVKAAAAGIGRTWGPAIAAAVAVAFGPELVKNASTALSGSANTPLGKAPKRTDFTLGIPKLSNKNIVGQIANTGREVGNTELNRLFGTENELRRFGDNVEETFKRLSKARDSAGLLGLASQARTLAKDFPSARKEMQSFGKAFERAAASIEGAPIERDMQRMAKVAGAPIKTLKKTIFETSFDITNRLGSDSAVGRNALAKNYRIAVQSITKSMVDGKVSTTDGMREIRRAMAAQSRLGSAAVSANFDATVGAIRAAMSAGVISTDNGMREIRRLLRVQLAGLGISMTDAEIARSAANKSGGTAATPGGPKRQVDPSSGKAVPGSGSNTNAARGGVIGRQVAAIGGYVGGPGMVSGDVVNTWIPENWAVFNRHQIPYVGDAMANFAGGGLVPVSVGYGEYIANPHEVGMFDQALQQRYGGGVDDLFANVTRPHYLASGGYAGGGRIPGVGVRQDLGLLSLISQAEVNVTRAAADQALQNAITAADAAAAASAGGQLSVKEARRVFKRALELTGKPSGPDQVSKLLSLAQQESGLNAGSSNDWDSNAAAGNPSKGILQTTLSTFASYKLPGYDNILNALDNAIASVRYQYARYGGLTTNSPYAQGGIVEKTRSLIDLQGAAFGKGSYNGPWTRSGGATTYGSVRGGYQDPDDPLSWTPASGIPNTVPGIATYAGALRDWWLMKSPKPSWGVLRRTDTGPGSGVPWDINSTASLMFGYGLGNAWGGDRGTWYGRNYGGGDEGRTRALAASKIVGAPGGSPTAARKLDDLDREIKLAKTKAGLRELRMPSVRSADVLGYTSGRSSVLSKAASAAAVKLTSPPKPKTVTASPSGPDGGVSDPATGNASVKSLGQSILGRSSFPNIRLSFSPDGTARYEFQELARTGMVAPRSPESARKPLVPNINMLRAINDSSAQVNAMTGGDHSSNSDHYKGLAFDTAPWSNRTMAAVTKNGGNVYHEDKYHDHMYWRARGGRISRRGFARGGRARFAKGGVKRADDSRMWQQRDPFTGAGPILTGVRGVLGTGMEATSKQLQGKLGVLSKAFEVAAFGTIDGLYDTITGYIRRLEKDGLSKAEALSTRRLRAILSLIDGEVGARSKDAVTQAEKTIAQVAATSDAQTLGFSGPMSARASFVVSSTLGRVGSKDVASGRLSGKLLDDFGLADRTRDRAGIAGDVAAATTTGGRARLRQRLLRYDQRTATLVNQRTTPGALAQSAASVIDPESARGLQLDQLRLVGNQRTLAQGRAGLEKALKDARAKGADSKVIGGVKKEIRKLDQAIAETAVSQIDNYRKLVTRQAQDRVDATQFGLDIVRGDSALFEASQRVTRTADTSGGMMARAASIGAQMPGLQRLHDDYVNQASVAWSIGDGEGFKAAFLGAQQAATDLATAQADAADLIREATVKAATEITRHATFGVAVADTALTGIELDQRLNHTYDTDEGRRARSDYITGTVVPRLSTERTALWGEVQTALSAFGEGSSEYDAAWLAWASKDNDIKQRLIDAAETTAENTEALKEFGGTLGFQTGGQNFTDLIGSGLGA